MENFEEALREFFTKNDKSKLKIVPKLVKNFQGNEEAVFNHLNRRYKLTKVEKHHTASVDSHGNESDVEDMSTEIKPKKSKKKVIMLSVIILLVAVLGGAGYMFKDTLMGGGTHSDSVEEGTEQVEENTDAQNEEIVPTEEKQAVIDSVEAMLDGELEISADEEGSVE